MMELLLTFNLLGILVILYQVVQIKRALIAVQEYLQKDKGDADWWKDGSDAPY